MAYTHIDCFSGPGGICTGLHAAGFETKVAIEFIQSCCETYAANHPEVHLIQSDIRNVKEEDILPYIPKGGVDLVTSGMPCETFSTAGNKSRSFYDDRQFLFREGIRIAKICKAKIILFENVPAITTKTVEKGSDTLVIDVLKHELSEAGYANYKEFILSADQFGVPQKRKRYFVLACKDPNQKLWGPQPDTKKPVTVKEALAGLPNVIPNSGEEAVAYTGEESSFSKRMQDLTFWKRESFTNHLTYQMPMKHRSCTMERFSLLRQGESLKDLFDRYDGTERKTLQERRVLPKKMFIKRNYRLISNQPSPTVTSHCLDEFVHPFYNRALTVRECARLQSFPDSYDFCGGPYLTPHLHNDIQDKYEQIGDAVPPLLAYAWGNCIGSILQQYTGKKRRNNMTLSIKELITHYKDEYDYCEHEYMNAWNSIIVDADENASENKKTAARRDAQKKAIDNAFIQSMAKFPDIDEEIIWALISLAHKLNIAHLEDFNFDQMQRVEIYSRCISAHQSWNKASGHSFERYIAGINKQIMVENEVQFILKSDAVKMIKEGKMYNHPDDLHLIEEWNDNFDLYAIQTNHGKAHIFGCIQVKTSIRDRVGRDDQFSKNAMEKNFWVAEAVLNGDFFKLPKYYAMVNGGSTTYPENNWHGVYVMTGIESDGRIYHDVSFDIMALHAVRAADCFGVNRAQLTKEWIAE